MAGAGNVSGAVSVRTDSEPDDSDDVGRSEADDLGGARKKEGYKRDSASGSTLSTPGQ